MSKSELKKIFEILKINIDLDKYNFNVEGEDEFGAGGIWDLSYDLSRYIDNDDKLPDADFDLLSELLYNLITK